VHGDVLLITDKQREAAKKIIDRIAKLKKYKPVIAVGGESGSGKTEIAHLTAIGLKSKNMYAKILHTDNYYKVSPQERTEWRMRNGVESINYTEYNWEQIKNNIKDFKENRLSSLPFLDLLTDQCDKLITDFSKVKILILEGLYSLYSDADLIIDKDYEVIDCNSK
jgi:uridine kinase